MLENEAPTNQQGAYQLNSEIDWSADPDLVQSADQAIKRIEEGIAESEAGEYEFEERIAVRLESNEAEFGWGGLCTAERAVDVLDHPEKFPYWYLAYAQPVAKAWLKTDSTARIFRRKAS
jgi:hypothetical protein